MVFLTKEEEMILAHNMAKESLSRINNNKENNMSKIQQQFDGIARDKTKWGTIFNTNDLQRGKGKSYNIEKVAEYFGFTVINKYLGREPRLGVEFIHRPTINHVRGKKDIFVLDEGFTIDEIREFKKHVNVVFAIWNPNHEKDVVDLKV